MQIYKLFFPIPNISMIISFFPLIFRINIQCSKPFQFLPVYIPVFIVFTPLIHWICTIVIKPKALYIAIFIKSLQHFYHARRYSIELLKVITQFIKYSSIKAEDSGPSWSLTEVLQKQDLFINSTLAQLGCNILWKMFRNGMIEHNGLFMNLDTMKVNPILVW